MYQLQNFEFVNCRNITQLKSTCSRIGKSSKYLEYSEVNEFNFTE